MIYKYILLFMMYSFLGWCMEVIVSLYAKHKFINRGFFIGPYCPIYGYGCLLMTFFLTRYKSDIIALFMMAIVICSILEYFTSFLMEKLFHARWWDYSDKTFNLNGRICMETMIPFGILGCIVIYVFNPFLINIIDKIPYLTLQIVSIFLIIIFVVDNIISLKIITNLKNTAFTIKKDSTEEITKRVKESLSHRNILSKRLVDAFPNLKILKWFTKEKLIETKKEIKKKQQQIKKIQRDLKKKQKILKKIGRK